MTIDEKKKQIIEALRNGETLSQIGREIFHSTGTASVNAFINMYGIPVEKYNSRYMFMNREWLQKQIEALGSPNKVAAVYGLPRTSVVRYARKYELYTPKFSRTKTNHINEHYFENIDTANKAYWLGLIMADGNIYHYKNSDKVQFEIKLQQKDKQLLIDFANDIEFPSEKIQDKESVRKGTVTYSSSLRTYNKDFCESLIVYGISDRKSGAECMPKQIPMEFRRDFIRGFWDGDGHISSNHVYVASLSFDIISQLSRAFAKSSIVTYVTKESTSTGKDLFRIYISAKSWNDFKNLIYYDGCIGLKRKIESARILQSTKYGE